MNHNHEIYMRRCFELARIGGAPVSPNPKVGAVLVVAGRIIGEGYHQKFGGPHAEVNAIASVAEEQRHLICGACLYISLEPCNFQGKTPPCTMLIIRHKIAKVVISCEDPNPKVSGGGIAFLRKAGIEVESGVLQAEGRALLGGFLTSQQFRMPRVILKYAQSADGFIGQKGQQIWLSNAFSKRLVHKWRGEVDAIMVGTNTSQVDNPQLNTRYGFGPSPLRVILDRTLRLNLDLKIFDGENRTLLVTQKEISASQLYKDLQVAIMQIPFDSQFIPKLLSKLHDEWDCCNILVEGGAQLLNSFISSGYWEEARVFVSSEGLESGIAAPKIPRNLLQKRIQLFENQLDIYYNSSCHSTRNESEISDKSAER